MNLSYFHEPPKVNVANALGSKLLFQLILNVLSFLRVNSWSCIANLNSSGWVGSCNDMNKMFWQIEAQSNVNDGVNDDGVGDDL